MDGIVRAPPFAKAATFAPRHRPFLAPALAIRAAGSTGPRAAPGGSAFGSRAEHDTAAARRSIRRIEHRTFPRRTRRLAGREAALGDGSDDWTIARSALRRRSARQAACSMKPMRGSDFIPVAIGHRPRPGPRVEVPVLEPATARRVSVREKSHSWPTSQYFCWRKFSGSCARYSHKMFACCVPDRKSVV